MFVYSLFTISLTSVSIAETIPSFMLCRTSENTAKGKLGDNIRAKFHSLHPRVCIDNLK